MTTPTIAFNKLTHCGRVTHICVNKLTIIGSDNGLLPDWCHTIILNNAEILLFGSQEKSSVKFQLNIIYFHSHICIWKCHLQDSSHFVSAAMLLGEVIKASDPYNHDIVVSALARTDTAAEPIFCLWLSMVWVNVRWYYLHNILSLWLKPCSASGRKLPRIYFPLVKFKMAWCINNRFLVSKSRCFHAMRLSRCCSF